MPTITTVDATWDNAVAMDAPELRRADTAMFLGDGTANGVRGGIVRHGDTSLAVSVNGSDQVTVQPGAFVVPAATGLGVYRGALSAATAATNITARNGTNPRIDLVAIQVTGTNATVKTIDGTPAVSPSVPALPAQHIEIARLSVPAVGGGAVTVDSSYRTYATGLGGLLYVDTAARLPGSGMQKGQRAVALDTDVDYRWNGTTWVLLNSPGGTLGYAQAVASQLSIGTTITDLTSLSVAVTVGESRRIRVSFSVPAQQKTSAGLMEVRIMEGATQLQRHLEHAGTAEFRSMVNSVILTPTAGAHTYKLSAATSANTLDMIAGATTPAYILVEDIGKV